jgi:peptide/nickel transport system substrate-binding protein
MAVQRGRLRRVRGVGQEIGRGGKNWSRRSDSEASEGGPPPEGDRVLQPGRVLRIVLAGGIAAALLYYYRAPQRKAGDPGAGAASRGGQIVGSVRSQVRSFNRLKVRDQTSDTINMLLQGRLVRINRATFEVEPWLAERWESSTDGLTHTFHLRPNLTWSDGAPFSSADVVFSLEAALDPKVMSVMATNMMAGGQPIRARAPDANTVVFTFAGPVGPGIRLFDALPILPKHKLGPALAAGTLGDAWGPSTPPSELVGMGPFVLREHLPGQRLVFDRNPRYWRTAADGQKLPYLDRIVLEYVPEQNAELLRLTSGAIDLTHSELRSEDYVPVRRAEEEGKVKLVELGVGTDADAFWFCMKPEVKAKDPRFRFLQKREFRQALSHAVDREELARTVFLGEAVPIWGPITPGNKPWFSPNVPRYPHDAARARELLKSIGLEDRNKNGIVEDQAGTEARFTVLTQRGITNYERGTMVLHDYAKAVGIELDIVALEPAAVFQRLESCNYDAIYMRALMSDLDPALTLDFWLSSGDAHLWNMSQKTPATDWEKQIDQLMTEQARITDPARRKALFNDVQRIFAENVPVLYFAAPRLFYGHSTRLRGVVPSVMRPQILWNADMLSVSP